MNMGGGGYLQPKNGKQEQGMFEESTRGKIKLQLLEKFRRKLRANGPSKRRQLGTWLSSTQAAWVKATEKKKKFDARDKDLA